MLIFSYFKAFFFLLLAFLIYYFSIKYQSNLWEELVYYLLFPIIFIILNYAFIKMILYYIRYYNNLIILIKDQIIFVRTTLIKEDNVEVIEVDKITKMDTKMEWIISNILSIGSLIVEQNRDRITENKYILKPYRIINYLKQMKKGNSKFIENVEKNEK